MDRQSEQLQRRGHRLMTIMLLVMVVLVVQLWLITIAVEEFMASHGGLALPTFGASLLCFLFNLRLLNYVRDLDAAG